MPSDAAAANPFQLAVPARVDAATLSHHRLYRVLLSPYTAFEGNLKLRCIIPIALHSAAAIFLLLALRPGVAHAQDAAQKTEEKPANKQAEKPPAVEAAENPAQIELLETRIRFEDDGGSRKEVHARVKINNELGARQFARLNFDYNRAFESIDVPLVRITHASGGTADILPSAITDQPNPAVVNAPAYQDVRVKSVRILGPAPGHSLEYRIITTVTKPPLAPDFWLNHSFDRTGVVSEEHFLVDLPASVLARSALIVVNNQKEKEELESRLNPNPGCGLCGGTRRAIPVIPAGETLPKAEYGKVQLFAKRSIFGASIERSGQGNDARVAYTWHRKAASQESDR